MERQVVEKDFVTRTMHILENYDGPYGVTLLINCLLGLIVLPRERGFNRVCHQEGIGFSDLGIDPQEICWGRIAEQEQTASRFLQCMRNSVAHIKIESISEQGEIESLRFKDQSGFEVVMKIEKVKELATKLAQYIH
ncbi:HEPN family nuclease [Dethiobacter alkaliphilus]|uniref:HEPN family nuclease n=1 Tax=Dethiobacter alkaliphilus TaxID=427926 RepID=UPI002227FE1B|nr:HEPN family nuclease [Dethiobacter alkaliphilus]MCW3491025.1 HEPN family nuclease [Dethiobacter alkaliphilus]